MIPRLNTFPKYEVVVPSTGKNIRFRPYTVKEEKIILTANESKDRRHTMLAIVDTLMACLEGENIDRDSLTLYDVEYLFTKIRSKSAGEKAPIQIKCQKCGTQNPYNIDLDNIIMEKGDGHNKIKLNDEVTVEVRYPTWLAIIGNENIIGAKNTVDSMFGMVAESIVAILTEDTRIETKDEDKKELLEFVESLTEEQFNKLWANIKNAPKLKFEIDFDCISCKEHSHYELSELNDFF